MYKRQSLPAAKKAKYPGDPDPLCFDADLPRPQKGAELLFFGELYKVVRCSVDGTTVFISRADDPSTKASCPMAIAQHLIDAQKQYAAESSPPPSEKPPPEKPPPEKPLPKKPPTTRERLERDVLMLLQTAANKKGLVKDPPACSYLWWGGSVYILYCKMAAKCIVYLKPY